MTPLTLAEQETHLSLSAADRSTWEIFSDDPVMIRKLESVGALPVRDAHNGEGKFFRLRANQVSFRKGEKRELSDAQRANIEKLAASRKKTNG